MDSQIKRLRISIGDLQSQGYTGKVLPIEQIRRNIRNYNIPATGKGSTRIVTITPANLHLFFKGTCIPEIALEKFSIADITQIEPDSDLEQLIFRATDKGPIHHKGKLSLDSLDLNAGAYLKQSQFASLLPQYDEATFLNFAEEAGIPTATIRGQGNQRWYLLDNATLNRLPRLDLPAVHQPLEIFTHKRIQKVVAAMNAESLDLDSGVWLLASQAAQLFQNYTARYFRKQADELGIKNEKIFGTERYFLQKSDLQRFPKKQLTENDIQLIRRLANILRHEIVAGMFECSAAYVGQLVGSKEREGKVQSKKIWDDGRFEQAIYCYFDYRSGPIRGVLYDHVLLPLANFMGRTAIKEIASFVGPFYWLHRKVKGVRFDIELHIKEDLKHCITRYILQQSIDYADTHRELPPIVTNDTALLGRGQTWTATNYFYLTAMQYFRQQFHDGLSKHISRYQEGLTGLAEDEQAYLVQRFGLNKKPQEIDWAQPTQNVMAVVLGCEPAEVTEFEKSILGKLRQPEFVSYFDGFGFQVYAHLNRMKGEFSLPERPKEIFESVGS